MPWDLFGALGVAVIVGGRVARDMNCLLCNSGGKHKPCYIISTKCMNDYLENSNKSKQNRIDGRRQEQQERQHKEQLQSSRHRNNHDTSASSSSTTNMSNDNNDYHHEHDSFTTTNNNLRQILQRARQSSPTSIIRNRLTQHHDLVLNNTCSSIHNVGVNYNAILHHAVIVDYNQQLRIWKDLVLAYHDLSPEGDAMYACQYIQSVLEWSQQQVPQALYIFVPEIIIINDDDDQAFADVDEKKDDDVNNNDCSYDDKDKSNNNNNNASSSSNRGFLLTIQQRFRTEANGGEPLDHLHDLSYKLLFAATTKKQQQRQR